MTADGSVPIRAVIWGLGSMGRLAVKLCHERGIEVVGAIARSPDVVGQDVGTLAGVDFAGVTVRSDAATLLAATQPDVVVLTTTSGLVEIEDQLRTCLTHGCNVVTLEEECLFPWSAPAANLAHELDELGRAHGATILATGVQDVFWHAMPSTLMASAQRVDVIRGRSTWNSDDYGATVQKYLKIGADPAVVTSGEAFLDWEAVTVRTTLQALAAAHDLTVTEVYEELRPIVAEHPVTSPRSGLVVPAGRVLGLSEHVTLHTREGVTLQMEMAGYLHGPGEVSINEWTVEGHPQVSIVSAPFAGRTVTCTALINRMPDVISAPPGFLSIDQLPAARYRHGVLRRPIA